MSPARNRAQQGSTLIMILVFIAIVGILGGAVLGLQHAVFRAQTAVVGKNTIDARTQNALTTAIEVLRRDLTGTMGRDSATLLAGCNDKDNASIISDYVDEHGNDVEVKCKPLPNSGGRGGGGGADVPRIMLVTLGGATGDGNDASDSNDNKVMFCDDGQGGGCEAGMYARFAEDAHANAGEDQGWFISSNGAASDQPVIKSNSSIIVDTNAHSASSYIRVEGGVWARRACTANRVIANYTPGGGTAPQCQQDEPAGTGTRPMTIDDCSDGRVDGVDCFPWQPRVGQIDALRNIVEPNWVAPGTPARMTPVTLPTPTCPSTGYLSLNPGYYPNIHALNDRIHCPDTLIHFQPGVYYLDNSDTANLATDVIDAPTRAGSNPPGQIVGGLPVTSGAGAWLPCDNVANTCPKQPRKIMNFAIQQNSGSSWVDANEAVIIDKAVGKLTATAQRELFYDKPFTQLPERAGTTVQHLDFHIKHKAEDGALIYAAGFPRLEVKIGSSAFCRIALKKGAPNLVDDNFKLLADTGEPAADTCTSASGTTPDGNTWTTSGSNWTTALNQVKTDSSKVNNIEVRYQLQSSGATPAHGEVDGIEMGVTYTGRPAPQFPSGCDSSTPGAGVQFVLGNTTHIDWSNSQGGSIELCGTRSPTTEAGGQYAIVLYGTPEHAGDPPRLQVLTAADQIAPGFANTNFLATDTADAATVGTIDGGDPTESTTCLVNCAESGVIKSQTFTTNTSNSTAARLSFLTPQLQNPADPSGRTDLVPTGSVITGLEFRLRHAEGEPGSAANNWVSPNTAGITGIKVTIGNGATPAFGPIDVPVCGKFKMPVGDPACDFRFGYPGASPDTDPFPAGLPFQQNSNWCWGKQPGSNGSGLANVPPSPVVLSPPAAPANSHCDYFHNGNILVPQRDLLDSFATAESLSSIRVTVSWTSTGSTPKVAWLDGLEMRVHFRPPGTVRPLRGCLTVRSGPNPHANAQTGANLGGHLVGVDQDWGANTSGDSDAPYVPSANPGSGDGVTCPLMGVNNDTSGNGTVKLHINGVVYAPTAALHFAGQENRAPFVSDGIVARHLTAYFWFMSRSVDTFGEDTGARANRHVWVWVELNGRVLAKTQVEYDDSGGRPPFAVTQTVSDYVLRPKDTAPP